MDIIIGAGATGLSYAAFTGNDYCIIEADNSIGGYCKTVKQDGFVWDYSGHFFHPKSAFLCIFFVDCSVVLTTADSTFVTSIA